MVGSTTLTYPPTKPEGPSILHAFQVCDFSSAIQYSLQPLVGTPCHPLREPSNSATYYYHRNMRTFNFTLLAMLSCIAVIGAIPVGDKPNHALAEAIARRQDMYVP